VCYHAEFGRSALKSVGINTREPQNWGALELCSLEMGGVADLKTHAPPTCYHVKFGSSATKGMRINGRKPRDWGALEKSQTFPTLPVYLTPC